MVVEQRHDKRNQPQAFHSHSPHTSFSLPTPPSYSLLYQFLHINLQGFHIRVIIFPPSLPPSLSPPPPLILTAVSVSSHQSPGVPHQGYHLPPFPPSLPLPSPPSYSLLYQFLHINLQGFHIRVAIFVL